MSFYIDDLQSHRKLMQLKEEALARKASRRAALGALPGRPGTRARLAAVLRATADHLAPAQPAESEHPFPVTARRANPSR
jgi:hypothetical protein